MRWRAAGQGGRNKYRARAQWVCPQCLVSVGSASAQLPCGHQGKPIYFHSTGELRRYAELVALEEAGEISGLTRQRRFDLDVNGVHVCRYTADFSYTDSSGTEVIEDYKGVDTTDSKLRRKLLYALTGIEVLVTRAR